MVDIHIANPEERSDFTCGHRICACSAPPWFQRITDRYGLVLILAGRGGISFDDGSGICAETGDLILLSPGYSHRFCPEEDWDLLWFHFLPRPHVTHALEWPESGPGLARIRFRDQEFDAVRDALLEAHSLDFRRPLNWNPLACLLLESVLVRGFNRSLRDASDVGDCVLTAQKLLLESGESIDRIAARCGMSRAALYAKFRRATGVSPRQYRERAMLRRAAQLLELPGCSIAEVARLVGMPNPYYFSTRFHKQFGVPPREYRRRKTGMPPDPQP